ncbi:UNVERIFIED_CONTAM: hypothetical protein K2H54_037551 [Gekko kuhli]
MEGRDRAIIPSISLGSETSCGIAEAIVKCAVKIRKSHSFVPPETYSAVQRTLGSSKPQCIVLGSILGRLAKVSPSVLSKQMYLRAELCLMQFYMPPTNTLFFHAGAM